MKILSIQLKNFGSYESLDFTFENGLTLIQGPNGSGKSTLMDAVPWLLFGVTAKNGKADEIRSWGINGKTGGTIALEHNGKIFQIGRCRNPNDLILWQDGGAYRGKDLNDTQRLINQHLGLDCEQYLSGAYYHEFSQTAQFFTTSAKSRRELCEQLVDLSLANTLQDKTRVKTKDLTQVVTKLEQEDRDLTRKLSLYKQLENEEGGRATKWENTRLKAKQRLLELIDIFEKNRKQVIKKQCKACGTKLAEPREVYDDSPNPHKQVLLELEKETNPHAGATKSYILEVNDAQNKLNDIDKILNNYRQNQSDVEVLSEVLTMFRNKIIENTMNYLQYQTNDLLEKYFDAELSVEFNMENDKLEVSIQKDGNVASYTQLSKGQRQLLKLCFSIATMKAVSNYSGMKFNQIFFDESLDGLADNLKIKAYRLFESLRQEYEGIFVIDHSEGLKALFDSQYSVTLNNGCSEVAKII